MKILPRQVNHSRLSRILTWFDFLVGYALKPNLGLIYFLGVIINILMKSPMH